MIVWKFVINKSLIEIDFVLPAALVVTINDQSLVVRKTANLTLKDILRIIKPLWVSHIVETNSFHLRIDGIWVKLYH